MHPQLTEQLGMKFQKSNSDKLNTWIIKDAHICRNIQYNRQTNMFYSVLTISVKFITQNLSTMAYLK